jgi:aconitate hydratase
MMKVAAILDGKTVAESVSLVVSPGSRQVLDMLAQNGALAKIIAAGARILEVGCGPCIGMGQAPATDAVSLRTFNRNFYGRSGTNSAEVCLVSPETAAVSALSGVITDPRSFVEPLPAIPEPEHYYINDNMIIPPAPEGDIIEVVRGPNIRPFPIGFKIKDSVVGKALIKLENNITTDHIAPAGAKLLPYRSNIPYQAEYCLTPCDPEFPARAKAGGGGIIIAGENYGQGSSREHAALIPLYLGIRAVIVKSFARIHLANLINNGILPLTFADPATYDSIDVGDMLLIEDARNQVQDAVSGKPVTVQNLDKDTEFLTHSDLTPRFVGILLAGGLLAQLKNKNKI